VLETLSKLIATPPPTARDTNACRFIERWSAGFGRWPELGLALRAARAAQQVAEPQNVLECAPAAIAPVESVQPEHAVDGVQFGRLDQFGVRDGDRKQRAFELFLPEGEEVL